MIDEVDLGLWEVDFVVDVSCFNDTELVVVNASSELAGENLYYYWYQIDGGTDADIVLDTAQISSDGIS